ncbi:potassium channel subfamily K member 2 isoform X2 [Aethina tumida]|uniref:potassium channel subfamily K member 2 isoform X2 n=1 Tax=Aethina tumida TaxID=116153 RepID=UPI0021475D33|nr:potassium channel subfamily K member 2 isoform X2 [Aethina tumida]
MKKYAENNLMNQNKKSLVAKFSMKSCGNVADSCVTIDQINLENGFSRSKLVERSAQTSHLIPYRLRFWPRLKSNVKLGPSESSCTKLRLICLCRVVSQWLLSQVGLTLILFIWALVGAYGFLITEGPREQQQSDDIIRIQDEIALELTDQLEKSTHTNWPEVMHKYMDKHKKLLLEAVSAGYGEGGEGRIWTYPGCILFSVSLLTTLGFGAPVPRTPQGRGAAILFAAVGIPLHFLLILNMGNLMAIKLQKLAFKGNPSDLPQPNAPLWLKWFPVVVITLYYFLGVIFFGFVRQRDAIDSFMFPLDFTAVGGVASVAGHVRVLYALYLEVAVTLAAIIVSLIQASTTRGIVDLCLRLGLLTNT